MAEFRGVLAGTQLEQGFGFATTLPPNPSAAIRTRLIVRWHTLACDTGNYRLYLQVSCCDNLDRPTIEPAFLVASMTDRAQPEITPHTPLRLADAAKIAFPMGGMTVAGLRCERDRNRLVIEKMAGKEFTTLAHIERMRELCRDEAREPGSSLRPDRVPERGVTGGGTPRSPARAGLVSWR